MLVSFKEIIQDAHQRKYAVGAFNCLSLENVIGAIYAAEELQSPIILQLAEVQFSEAPMELMAPLFIKAAHDASVPVCVHLDHGQSVETCIRAIRAGFNSVMFDGANLPFGENVEKSSIVTSLAHACGVDVEAELGKVGDTGYGNSETGVCGSSDVFTDVKEAVDFVSKTGADALAIAIGNLHGRYVSTPQLNIPRLKEIDAAIDIPLVLHGGSGTSEADFKACIHNGISKINVATAIQIAVTDALSEYLSTECRHDYTQIKRIMIEASKRSIASHMLLFESVGKA